MFSVHMLSLMNIKESVNVGNNCKIVFFTLCVHLYSHLQCIFIHKNSLTSFWGYQHVYGQKMLFKKTTTKPKFTDLRVCKMWQVFNNLYLFYILWTVKTQLVLYEYELRLLVCQNPTTLLSQNPTVFHFLH